MLSHPRKELHKVYVLDKARPSLPRVPTNLLVHPMDSLTDQGVRAQRGEIQSCEGMGTFIAVLLREGHVRLYHAGRKVSQLTVSVCRDLRVFLAPREERGPKEGKGYKPPERPVRDFSRHLRAYQRCDVWPQDQYDSDYRPGQDERGLLEYRDDETPKVPEHTPRK